MAPLIFKATTFAGAINENRNFEAGKTNAGKLNVMRNSWHERYSRV
jgi:hypothetical protein